MLGALLAATILFQAATAAAPGAEAPAANRSVSGVTVNGQQKPAVEVQASTMVCHEETPIGSKFPKKVCATKREFSDRAKYDKEVARDFSRSTIEGAQPH